MDYHFHILVVANNPASAWVEAAARALTPLGRIYLLAEREAAVAVGQRRFDLALVDTSALEQDVADLVKVLLRHQEELPVMVVTTSPTWQRARAVFLAGAMDYVRRTFDEQKLRDMCQTAIFRRKAVARANDSSCGQ